LIKDGGWAVVDFRGFDLSCYGYTAFETNGNKINKRELLSIHKIYIKDYGIKKALLQHHLRRPILK